MKHLSRLLLAVVAAGALSLAGSNSAQAALVVRITDSAADTPVVLTSSGNTLLSTFTIGVYTVTLESVTTNFPGATFGSLTTTTTLSVVDGGLLVPAPTLFVDAGVFTTTTGTTLANFTSPSGATLVLKNDVTAAGVPLDAAVAMGTSTSNGTTSPPSSLAVGVDLEKSSLTPFAGQPVTGFYTLQNHTELSGIVGGDSGISATVASTVTAPEPSTLAAALVALPCLGIAAWRRKRSNPA